MADNPFLDLIYFIAAVLFIVGLKLMSHPRTAVKGNLLGSLAMLIAVLMALFGPNKYGGIDNWTYVIIGIGLGGLIGALLAIRIQMTSMPQLVGLFNGLGGAASVLVAGAELYRAEAGQMTADVIIAIALSGIIGAVTFWGSFIAFGKLQELKMFKKPFSFPGGQVVNAILALVLLSLTAYMLTGDTATLSAEYQYILIVIVASFLGVLLVNPIGGADMPVVIALLNSYSGLAASATGFVINNPVLIIAGSLVGASGLILTKIMCKAMNRSLFNVLFGVIDAGSSTGNADEIYATVRSTSPEDVAMILDGAQRVGFVPGYGMAVAQAQHAVRDLGKLLEQHGAKVEYAIHPVAGRMPGHMNVLLAEADVDYDKLVEMDDINPTLETVDVCIVIGANDVVNPEARNNPDSPIAGMPIIDVDKARNVIVIKRSLSPGFAGIPNPLFAAENTLMLFGDGQKAILETVAAVKENA